MRPLSRPLLLAITLLCAAPAAAQAPPSTPAPAAPRPTLQPQQTPRVQLQRVDPRDRLRGIQMARPRPADPTPAPAPATDPAARRCPFKADVILRFGLRSDLSGALERHSRDLIDASGLTLAAGATACDDQVELHHDPALAGRFTLSLNGAEVFSRPLADLARDPRATSIAASWALAQQAGRAMIRVGLRSDIMGAHEDHARAAVTSSGLLARLAAVSGVAHPIIALDPALNDRFEVMLDGHTIGGADLRALDRGEVDLDALFAPPPSP